MIYSCYVMCCYVNLAQNHCIDEVDDEKGL